MLRERIPTFDASLDPGVPGGVIPRMKPPVSVAFRTGADLGEVCGVIAKNRNVLVEAAPMAGKSVRLPAALAKAMNCLVVHVMPSERLADHVYTYVKSTGVDCELMLTAADSYPKQGVVFLSAGVVVAKWLAAGAVVMPECVVYHDESHESDAYTYLVKTMSLTTDSVRAYVSATATAGASGFRTFEPAGDIIRGTFEEPLSSWDPFVDGYPWSVNSMRGNALLFVDSKSSAAQLVESYATAGFVTYRLHSRMDLKLFRAAMDALSNPNGPIVILVADSSFRSGFTLDVSSIVDSGMVGYMDVSSGRPVRCQRPLYELEKFQSIARGARFAGLRTEYWCPAGLHPESSICDLMPFDMEAVTLILRILGYVVPRSLDQCVMATSGVPRELCAALQREQPLALMRPDQLVDIVEQATPTGRRSPFLADDVVDTGVIQDDVIHPEISADVSDRRGSKKYVKSAIPRASWDDSWQEDLQALMRQDTGVREMKIGRAYYASGLQTDSDESIVFPDGVESVLRFTDDASKSGAIKGLNAWHRSIAVNLLLSRQGALAAEMDGIRRALSFARGDQSAVGTPAARDLASNIAERLAMVSSSLAHVGESLMKLGTDFCSYHEMEVNVALSDSVCESWSEAWRSLPRVNSHGALSMGFSIGREGRGALRVVGSGVRARLADRPYVPMSRKGAGMRAIAPTMSTVISKSVSDSVASDERCTGSTYWNQTVVRDEGGRLVSVRRLVCERCGPGASKRAHGVSKDGRISLLD